MTSPYLNRWLERIARIGAGPADSGDVRLRKSLLVIAATLTAAAGLIWAGLYLAFGEPWAAGIPLSYSVLTSASVARFASSRRYGAFRFRQLLLILLLPFALKLTLGGFVASSGVILWSLLSPLGALLFSTPRQALGWFAAYAGLVAVSLLLQPYLRTANNLPPAALLGFFAMNVIGPSVVAFAQLAYFVSQNERYLDLLRLEQAKSDGLLLNILPREIAAILKNENRTIADHYDGASILFADLVGFTPLSAAMPPAEMVELLNRVFSHFDSLVEKHGVEKIRTIGDSYMVASGVPRPRPDHAQALAHLALDMLAYCHSEALPDGRRLAFRVGINSGPVVAGVIGRKKFIYDLWGDAVNIASRMESHGEAGKVQITAATRDLVQSEFICEPRGRVLVKGKGEMETWYLLGRRNGSKGDQAA
jgi:guanylate cyclase